MKILILGIGFLVVSIGIGSLAMHISDSFLAGWISGFIVVEFIHMVFWVCEGT